MNLDNVSINLTSGYAAGEELAVVGKSLNAFQCACEATGRLYEETGRQSE